MLRLAEAWTWDFWLADDGRSYHLYFLKAPRHIGDPDRRHWNASIGHATSPDLADWTVVCDAITPSGRPAFDDIATWTGSVVRGRDGAVICGVFNVNRPQAAASLRRLATLDIAVACFGHGEPVTRDAGAELQAAARRLPAEPSEHG